MQTMTTRKRNKLSLSLLKRLVQHKLLHQAMAQWYKRELINSWMLLISNCVIAIFPICVKKGLPGVESRLCRLLRSTIARPMCNAFTHTRSLCYKTAIREDSILQNSRYDKRASYDHRYDVKRNPLIKQAKALEVLLTL